MYTNFSQKRFAYTSGNELYLNGESYVGYFNTLSGDFFTGKDRTETSEELLPGDRIETDYFTSNFYKDRKIFETDLSLPYDKDSLSVAANEFITYTAFSELMKRVHENTMYIYSKTFIADNDLPLGNTYWAGISAQVGVSENDGQSLVSLTPTSALELQWYSESYVADTVNGYEIGLPDLDLIKKIQTVKTETGNTIAFGVTPNKIITLSSDANFSTINVSFSSDKVDQNTLLEFRDIVDISIYDNKCYIADGDNNIVYKYDISSYLFDNPDVHELLLEEAVGGSKDNTGQKFIFNSIRRIDASEDKLFVQDSNNRIRVLDKNFSWIADIVLTDEDRYDTILSFKYNDFHDFLLVIVGEQNSNDKYFLYIQINGSAVNTSNKYPVNVSGNIQRIVFSSENSNVFYASTSRDIYKFFISNISAPIGEWRLNNLGINFENVTNFIETTYDQIETDWENMLSLTVPGDEDDTSIANATIVANIKDIDIIPGDNNDIIFTIANVGEIKFIPGISSLFGNPIREAPLRIVTAVEQTNYDTILQTKDFNFYTKSRIGPDSTGYINSLTINNELYKHIYNIIHIAQTIKGRFVGVFRTPTSSMVYNHYEYLSLDDITNIDVNNFFIHENEHLSYSNINRCLSKIYDLQEKIINTINTRVKNLSPN